MARARKRTADDYRRQNVLCAQVILADVAKYGGPEAGLVRWARAVLDNAEQRPAERETVLASAWRAA